LISAFKDAFETSRIKDAMKNIIFKAVFYDASIGCFGMFSST